MLKKQIGRWLVVMRGLHWRRWFGRSPERRMEVEKDVDREIELHLQMRAEQLVRRGLDPRTARLEAMRRFGSLDEVRHRLGRSARQRERRMRIREWTDGLWQDLRQALKTIGREPGVSAVLVATMALGIGANAAMFGIIDQMLLRGPERVRSPDELMRFYIRVRQEGRPEWATSAMGYVWYRTLRQATNSFEGVSAYATLRRGTVGRGLAAQHATLGAVTADMFPLLGVRPVLGRFFTPEEDLPPMGEKVAVISYGMWRSRFGGSPAVLGQRLYLGDDEFTIIGVAPEGFNGPERVPVRAWIPMATYSREVTEDWEHAWTTQWLSVIGRLRPTATREQAEREGTSAFHRAYTGTSEVLQAASIGLAPLTYDRQMKEPLEISVSRWLMGVSAIVLLIACANVMNVHLARMIRQRKEVAIRLAMGIGRWRLTRLLIVHGVVLAVMGGVLALAVAEAGSGLIRTTLLPAFDWHTSVMDGRVLAFTGALALLVGVVTSAIPALRAGRVDPAGDLRQSGGVAGPGSVRLRNALTIVQAMLSVILLFGAALFARSLGRARSVDLGIDPSQVLEISLHWPASEGTWVALRPRRTQAYAEALAQANAMPGVERAALAVGTPFESAYTMRLSASDWDSIPHYPGGGPYVSAVTADYFALLGLDRLRGRLFTAADRDGSEPVAIVDRKMAADLWPAGDAIGKCLYIRTFHDPAPCSRIVGIVEEAHRSGLREEPALQYYVPLGQERGMSGTELLIRPRGMISDDLVTRLRAAFITIDPGVSFIEARTLADSIDPLVRPWRLGAIMFSLFGALALLIAVIGLYSVISYGIVRRTREIGVRMALGARSSDVLLLVLRQGVTMAAVGLVLGSVVALCTGRFVETLLFETSPWEPGVLAMVVIAMLVAATMASIIPAAKASAIDPVEALRRE